MQGSRAGSTNTLPLSLRPARPTPLGKAPSTARRSEPARIVSGKIPLVYSHLFAMGILLVAAYHAVLNPGNVPPSILLRAISVFCLGSTPMFLFLRKANSFQIPCFETHALFYAVCFGFAGFRLPNSLPDTMTVDWQDVSDALNATLVGLVALGVGYYLPTKIILSQFSNARTLPVQDSRSLVPIAVVCCVIGSGLELIGRVLHIASLAQGPGLVFSFGFLSLYVLGYERRLSPVFRSIFLFGVAPVIMAMRSGLLTGQLAGSAVVLLWICIVTMRVKRRIPVVLFSVVVFSLLVLQPVKFYVRNLVWTEERHLSPMQVMQAYVEGFEEVYGSTRGLFANHSDIFQNSFDRVNHLITTAAIIHDTPSKQPFLHGSTYLPLLTKWIPRFLWHDKPEERIGNEWASNYGYLHEFDETTSYNLPWLPEMYMNFGSTGVIVIMFLLGVMFRVLWRVLMQFPAGAADCASAVVLTQSLVFAESNLSLMLGGSIIFVIILGCLRSLVSAGSHR